MATPQRPDELTRLLLRLGPVLVRHQFVMARHLGLEPVEYLCLELLDRLGPVPVRVLAERTGLSSSTASRLIDRLEEAGRVERWRNRDDRRSVLVARRADPEWERARSDAIAPLDRALRALLPADDDRRRTLVAVWLADATDAVHGAGRDLEETDRLDELARARADRGARGRTTRRSGWPSRAGGRPRSAFPGNPTTGHPTTGHPTTGHPTTGRSTGGSGGTGRGRRVPDGRPGDLRQMWTSAGCGAPRHAGTRRTTRGTTRPGARRCTGRTRLP